MKTLTAVYDEERVAELRTVTTRQLSDLRGFLFETPLHKPITITLAHGIDEDGTDYFDIEIRPEVRYKDAAGDVWLVGGGFTVNASVMLREIDELLVAALA